MILEESWKQQLKDEIEKPYFLELTRFLQAERLGNPPIYPQESQVFNAFLQTPFPSVKVVLMGQDPYHGKGQAHGLSFSVSKGITIPPSLKNIYKEIEADLGIPQGKHGCLLSWARQGVLLLNATLTVRESNPKSHFGHGWEVFTDAVVRLLSKREDPLVFMLWGKSAHDKCTHLLNDSTSKHHLVLTAAHPSPYSATAGFFGCRHFSKTNDFLISNGKAPIDWSIQ